MAEMYNWDKSCKEGKSNRNTPHQSFSSTLLDEIYRSMDGSDEKFGEMKLRKPKVAKKQSGGGQGRLKGGNVVEDDEIAGFRRACSVEKWMEMKCNKKVTRSRKGTTSLPEFDRNLVVDNDPMFFSSGSSSSDSSFGWCSEVEAVKPKHSCFGPLNGPKQVKTSVSTHSDVEKQNEFQGRSQDFPSLVAQNKYPLRPVARSVKVQLLDRSPMVFYPSRRRSTGSTCYHNLVHGSASDEFYLPDDDQTYKTDNSGLIRSKTRALKIYTSLKKVKQPISPGGRLTTFLNGLFTNGDAKKPKDSSIGDQSQARTERKPKSTNVSKCSSASSFSRSCLSKNSPRSRDQVSNRMQRTVRFQDHKDPHPRLEKNVCKNQDFWKLPSTFTCPKARKLDFKEFLAKFEEKKFDFDEQEDDMASDSSSDLFELNHLATFKNNQYFEELPVFETTHLGTNHAIASG